MTGRELILRAEIAVLSEWYPGVRSWGTRYDVEFDCALVGGVFPDECVCVMPVRDEQSVTDAAEALVMAWVDGDRGGRSRTEMTASEVIQRMHAQSAQMRREHEKAMLRIDAALAPLRVRFPELFRSAEEIKHIEAELGNFPR